MARRRRAVFLDRDGVINAAVVRDGKPYPPVTLADFSILPGVAEACRLLHDAGFRLIVASNQPDVGRGQLDRAIVEDIHRAMCERLPIDRIEVCYDPGGTSSSEFRKPRPGMLLRAAEALDIDLSRSFMVGDRWRDIDCGHAAGCKTIFIDRGYDEPLRMQPDFTAPDLLEAARLIVSFERDASRCV
ncbi:MAG: HAD-IIIA family hydrolase [Acidobacteriaceae bacterium]|nr:HAD-IIIA family hydrolase [Acidobacteriaceae bacterium]